MSTEAIECICLTLLTGQGMNASMNDTHNLGRFEHKHDVAPQSMYA